MALKTLESTLSTGNQHVTDEETAAALYEGLTLTQLARAFGMDGPDIQSKIKHVQPAGRRRGYAIYRIKDVAPYLVKPVGDISDYLKRMNPRDLPPLVAKEFWNGQNARLKFEKEEGDLWPIDQVMEYVGDLLKIVRMSALTAADAIHAKTTLDEKQRQFIDSRMRAMLEEIRVSAAQNFGERATEEREVRAHSLATSSRSNLTVEDDDEGDL